MAELTMVEALNRALDEELGSDERVLVLGEDVGRDGGIFRVTDGLMDKYGKDRVVDTPLAEVGIVGSAVGLAIGGMLPVAEIQFSGFSYQTFHQIESHAARMRKRTRGRFTVPLTIRMPYGAGVHALEHHSESRETYWIHTPGLKVVVPRSPRKAWSLLRASIQDPDPVIFLEPKNLYRKFREEVPDDGEVDPEVLGQSEVLREGDDCTLVAFGSMMERTLNAAETLASDHGIETTVIDLQTLSPMDSDTVIDSVKETGRCVVVHEAHRTLGIGAEIIARINDDALLYLEAPVKRVTGYDVQVPLFAREQDFMPDEVRIVEGVQETVAF